MHRLTFIIVLLATPAFAKPHAILKGHQAVVSAVAFSPDGKLLASGAWDRMIRIWNVKTGKLVSLLKGHQGWVKALRFQSNSRLTSASDRNLLVWNVVKKTIVSKTRIPTLQITSMQFSSDARRLIIGTRDGMVWIRRQGGKPFTQKVHNMAVTAVALQHQGDRFAAGSSRGQLKLGSTKTKRVVELGGHDGSKIFSLAFAPDDSGLASGAFDTTIRIWDVATGVGKGVLRGHKGLVMSLKYGIKGGTLASGGRHGSLHVWNLGSLKPQKSFNAHPGQSGYSVLALDISRDGKWIATGAYDQQVKLWALKIDP